MQYYINELNLTHLTLNLNNKLSYILKKKKINYTRNSDNLILYFDKINLIFTIYFNNLIPQFVMFIGNENNYISSKCDNINMNIDKYEFIDDVVCEIYNIYEKSLNIIVPTKSIISKDLNKFEKLLEEKKEFCFNKNKNNRELNSTLKMFSLKSYIEMLGDQIIKIYNYENFNVEINDFPNIKIFMEGFTFKGSNNLEITIDMNINLNFITNPPSINISSNKILKDNILKVISQLKPFSSIDSWSIKYSIYNTVVNIFNMINTYGETKLEFTSELFEIINDLEYLVSIKNQNISESKLIEIFDPELLTNLSSSTNLTDKIKSLKTNTYWKQGTGYGHNGAKKWDIDEYIQTINEKKDKIVLKFNKFIELLENHEYKTWTDELIIQIIDLLFYWISNEEITQSNIIKICDIIDKNQIIYKNYESNQKYIKLLAQINSYLEDNDTTHKLFKSNNSNIINKINNFTNNNSTDEFVNLLYDKMFCMYVGEFKNFYYKILVDINSEKLLRLKREFSIIKKSIGISQDASIFFWIEKNKLNKMRFIVTGPTNTPYDQGLYIFDMTLSNEYPYKPPQVHFSNNGNQRFNPNLYNCGKVCLSLLGTWSGDKGESWNSVTSTFLQILISIQSQILVEEPYFNEPGHEGLIGKSSGIANSKSYNDNIRQYNLDNAINGLINGVITGNSDYPEFNDLIRKYFKFKKQRILDILNKWENEYTDIKLLDKFKKSKNKFIELSEKL